MLRPYASFCEQRFPADPGFGAGFAVGFAGVGRFSGAHEAVAGALVRDWLESFAGCFHVLNRLGKSSADARVVSRVEAIHRSRNACYRVFIRRRPVEYESGREIAAIRCEAEGLPAAPAVSGDKQFAVAGRQFLAVVGGGIEVGSDLI